MQNPQVDKSPFANSDTLDAIIEGRVKQAIERISERIAQKNMETLYVMGLVYDGKINFVDELRLLDEIDAKYSD